MEIARAVFYGAEAIAQPLAERRVGTGRRTGLRAFHLQTGKIYSRFVEIVQTLAAGGFFYAPTEADLASAEMRPYIDRYVRGRPGVSAEERIALFKLAWDVTGRRFAQRMAQYVRYYSGDPIRLTAGFYTQYDKAPLFDIVERALGRRDGEPIPLSPDDPAAPVPYQPGTRGMAARTRRRRCPRAAAAGARARQGVVASRPPARPASGEPGASARHEPQARRVARDRRPRSPGRGDRHRPLRGPRRSKRPTRGIASDGARAASDTSRAAGSGPRRCGPRHRLRNDRIQVGDPPA